MRCRLVLLGGVLVLLAGCTSTSAGPPNPTEPRRTSTTLNSASSGGSGSPDPSTTGNPPMTSPGETSVSTVQEIRDALASAKPGAVIRVADGEYQFKPRLVASASGTADQPITSTSVQPIQTGSSRSRVWLRPEASGLEQRSGVVREVAEPECGTAQVL